MSMHIQVITALISFSAFISIPKTCSSQSIDFDIALNEIIQLEKELLIHKDATKTPKIAEAIIEKSLRLVQKYPKRHQIEAWLFKSGDIARGLKKPKQAIRIWQQLQDQYPNSTYSPKALFAQGFTADADAKEQETAKKYYLLFLKKYPKHHYAEQVKLLLTVIDKSSDDLIRQFEGNQ